MAAKKNHVELTNDVTWKYQVSATSDRASSTLVYKDDFEGWASRVPVMKSNHPDIPALFLVDLEAEREPGGQIKVTLKYESSLQGEYPGRPEGQDKIRRYACEISNGEEHILTHSRYATEVPTEELKALLAISNGTEQDADGVFYETLVTSDLGLEVLAKIRKGNTARKSFGLIWVEKFTSDDLEDINYPMINKIEQPPVVGGGETNWLYLGSPITETAEGEVYEFEKRWEFSADGWDTDLYTAAP